MRKPSDAVRPAEQEGAVKHCMTRASLQWSEDRDDTTVNEYNDDQSDEAFLMSGGGYHEN
jgi:hypothetical protein